MSRFRTSLLLVLALSVAAAVPASASAANQGTTTIKLEGKSVASLRAQGVTIAARRPAKIVKGTLRLPVTGGLVTGSATLNQGGALVLRRTVDLERLSIEITRLQARIGRTSSVVGTIGSKRFAIFTIAAKGASLNAVNGSASLRGAKVTLNTRAARAIKAKLALKRLPAAGFGSAIVDAIVTGSGGSGAPGGGNTPGGGGSTPGGGGGGGGTPESGPIGPPPALLERPALAVTLNPADMALTWSPRDSWLGYVASGGSTTASGGAAPVAATAKSPCPDASPNGTLPYSFTFTPVSGWYDAASGYAGLYFGGGLHFGYPSHGIDISASNPELEITTSSRSIYHMDDTPKGTINQRVAFTTLAATPEPGRVSGDIVTYTNARGRLTTDGENVLADFYTGANNGFGCSTFSFKVP